MTVDTKGLVVWAQSTNNVCCRRISISEYSTLTTGCYRQLHVQWDAIAFCSAAHLQVIHANSVLSTQSRGLRVCCVPRALALGDGAKLCLDNFISCFPLHLIQGVAPPYF